MATNLKTAIRLAYTRGSATGRAETEAKYRHYLDTLRQAGLNIHAEIHWNQPTPPATPANPKAPPDPPHQPA